jgi:hypothetical protein
MEGPLQIHSLGTSKETFSKHFRSEITPKLAKKVLFYAKISPNLLNMICNRKNIRNSHFLMTNTKESLQSPLLALYFELQPAAAWKLARAPIN